MSKNVKIFHRPTDQPTDRQTDRPTNLLLEAPPRSLKINSADKEYRYCLLFPYFATVFAYSIRALFPRCNNSQIQMKISIF